jgi:hypothetical protein
MDIHNFTEVIANQQIYAGDSNCTERGISAGPGEYQRDT